MPWGVGERGGEVMFIRGDYTNLMPYVVYICIYCFLFPRVVVYILFPYIAYPTDIVHTCKHKHCAPVYNTNITG